MQSRTSGTLGQRDSVTFAVLTLYKDDCPAGVLLDAIAPTQLRGEWIKTIELTKLCVVSTSNPRTAPGLSGSRALPPWIPDPVLMPWVEVPDGVVADAAIDNVRGMAYTSNFTGQSVDIYSFASQTIVGSIPVGGSPQRLTLSADGNTLYAGVFYQGEVVAIDLMSRTVTARVTLTSLLGSTNVWSIAEISPGHLLVGALPEQTTGPNTYLVDVIMSNPSSAQRVGCPLGYYTAKPVISPDKHSLYLLDVAACPPEKRDLTLPGYPVVRSGPPGGYLQGGTPVITADGAHLVSGGVIIDTSTMQQTAYTGSSSLALPSQNPDRFYVFGLQAIVTIELHDLKILSIAQNGCQVGIGIDGFSAVAMSADEKTFITVNNDVADLCVTQIAP